MTRARKITLTVATALLAACPGEREALAPNDPRVYALSDLSIETLRKREYGSQLSIKYEVQGRPSPSFIASYNSDGLNVYTRIDLPADEAPPNGYPVVILVHGWMGIDAAPNLDFYYDGVSNYSQIIDAYIDAGFAVFTPGWRGHGTINDVPADGIEFMRAWDNGSYLSPVFYAIDVLNLLDSLDSFREDTLDLKRVNMYGHSQGGDVALIALAIAGEDSAVANNFFATSIWSGNIPSRLTQLETFWPMQTSPEAFLSGDGSWNGTAVGTDGSVNPNFVFGFPSDWIGTVDVADWSWQKNSWSNGTVAEALSAKLEQMYSTINSYVIDMPTVAFEIEATPGRKTLVAHDARIIEELSQIGAFDYEQFLTERLALHHSDRDFYSLPEWNADLCKRANAAGGRCFDFTYPGNTHSLRISEHEWFSPPGSSVGFSFVIQRDISLFSGRNPSEISFP